MKKLTNYGVIEIKKFESFQINGGTEDSFMFKLGAAAHRTWNAMVDGYLNTYTPTHIWGA